MLVRVEYKIPLFSYYSNCRKQGEMMFRALLIILNTPARSSLCGSQPLRQKQRPHSSPISFSILYLCTKSTIKPQWQEREPGEDEEQQRVTFQLQTAEEEDASTPLDNFSGAARSQAVSRSQCQCHRGSQVSQFSVHQQLTNCWLNHTRNGPGAKEGFPGPETDT